MLKEIKINNKTTLLYERNKTNPLISFNIFFKGGLKLENKSNNGITNLTLKLLGKKTKTKNFLDIYNFLDTNSIKFKKGIMPDYTYFSITCLKKDIKESLNLVKDIILNSQIDEKELKKEKELIIEKIKAEKDNLYKYSSILFNSEIFKSHPYGLKIKGEIENIKKFTLDDIIKWKENILNNNIIISVVGDIQEDEVIKLITNNLSDFLNLKTDDILEFKKPKIEKTTIIEKYLNKQQATINIGFILNINSINDYFTFKLLTYTISGMGSKLFINLRDKLSLAYSVYGRFIPLKDVSIFKFFMGTANEKLEFAIKSFLNEIYDIKSAKFTKEEIEKGKNYAKGIYYISTQTNIQKSFFYANNYIIGLKLNEINNYINYYDAINLTSFKEKIFSEFNKPYLLLKIKKGR